MRLVKILSAGILIGLIFNGAGILAGDRPAGNLAAQIQDSGIANHAYVVSSLTAPAGYQPKLTVSHSPGTTLAGGMVGLFKDVNPWGSVAAEAIFNAHGIPYEVHTSSEFAALDFSQFEMIVICSDQPQGFYNAYAANQAKFTSYVNGGGFLNFFAADRGWQSGQLTAPLPGGMTTVFQLASSNMIVDPSHPVAGCAPNPVFGTWASHGYFGNVPAGAVVIAEIASGSEPDVRQTPPTLVEYRLGMGTMLASTMTLEIAYDGGWDAAVIYENALLYGYGLPTCTSFDLIYLDEFGRSKLCVNSQTGDFSYQVLRGAGVGEYTGQAYLSLRNGVLFIHSTTLTPRLQFYDNQKFHKAYGSYTRGTLRSYLDDRNTADDPATCNEAINE